MSENRLEVYTLGRFLVKKDDTIISEKRLKSHKLWHLFKILISSPDRVFTVDELIDKLDLSLELYDAKNAVQNLIFRLRKILAIGEKYDAGKYIIYEQFGYSFNWDADYYIDFIDFKCCCQKSEEVLKGNKGDDLPDCALEAVKIYRGDFLHENTEINWINQKRLYLKKLYLEEIYLISDLLKQRGEFAKIEEVCEQALIIEPFVEEIHYNLLNALVKQDKKQKAKLHYQYLLNIYSLNKIKLTSNISSLLEEIEPFEQRQREEIELIKSSLRSFAEEEELYFVDKKSFNYFCWISIRKKDRKEDKVFLISVSLNINSNKINDNQYQEIINYLEKILKNNLRKIDVICKWNKVQYLILFDGINLFEVQEIISRIRKSFYQKGIPQEIIINLDSIEL